MGVKRTLHSLALSLLMLAGYAQPTIAWQKSLGGSGNEYANSVKQTSDGGYIVAGYSNSNNGDVTVNKGNYDFWVVKLSSTGAILWQKSLGGSADDKAYAIQQTNDGGYIVAGTSHSADGDLTVNQGSSDIWLVKLSSTGIIDWQKSYGASGYDEAYDVKQTGDGGYIVAGYSTSSDGDDDFRIIKTDSSGNSIWQKYIGGSDHDIANSINQTTDGGYIVAGETSSTDGDVLTNHGYVDIWVVKLTSSGVIDWQKSLGGSEFDQVRSVIQTNDGGYIIAGFSKSIDGDVNGNHGMDDFWVVKLTSNGSISWKKCLGGSQADGAMSIHQTTEGGYIVTGTTFSNDGDVTLNHGFNEIWVVKLTNLGVLEWQKSYGGTQNEISRSVRQTSDGGYIVAGSSSSNDGDVTGNHGQFDCWVVKLSAVIGEDELEQQSLFSIYPNPAKDKIKIKTDINVVGAVYTIYNILGNSILAGKLQNETNSIDLGKLGSGVYVMQLKTSGEVFVSRFSKE